MGLAALTLLSKVRRVPGGERSDGRLFLGETVSTRWFDCTVEEAEARKSYESDTASSGNKLVVVELELKTPSMRRSPCMTRIFSCTGGMRPG